MLNYHHLRYFHAVAREGNLTRASVALGRTPQTVSHQIKALEDALGTHLFERRGRRLVLTPEGEKTLVFAEEIFSLGEDLMESVEARAAHRPIRLTIGVADVLPKRIAHALILPALQLGKEVRSICREAAPERLLADLAVREVDVVLSDAPIPPSVSIRAHSHLLGECGATLMGSPELVQDLREGFPSSLSGSPLLVPTARSALRREIDLWLDTNGLHPRIVGEFDDFALMGTFAQSGTGVIPVPSIISEEVGEEWGIQEVGLMEGVVGRFYAITLEEHGENQAIGAILAGPGKGLFG